VVDNLYFIGTKIHSARAITGGEGMIVIEAPVRLCGQRCMGRQCLPMVAIIGMAASPRGSAEIFR
jgi:hypothetical protein